MRKHVALLALVATLSVGGLVKAQPRVEKGNAIVAASQGFYALHVKDIDDHDVPLSKYVGHVTLVVNVASHCGFTPQYEGLEKLYKDYASQGFVILAFPSNDFGGQEPGTPAEIKTFCSSKYSVTFPLFAKVGVKNGATQSEVYHALSASGHTPEWNFGKYLIGKDGTIVKFFPSAVTPQSDELKQAIDNALHA